LEEGLWEEVPRVYAAGNLLSLALSSQGRRGDKLVAERGSGAAKRQSNRAPRYFTLT
jgi:hypothetical protein